MNPEAPINPALLQQAKYLVISRQEASVSLLQRSLKLGHTQALNLMASLVAEDVVTPVNFAGFNMLSKNHVSGPVLAPGTPRQKHIRLLRDMALYMLESHEEGHAGNSGSIKAILHPLHGLWSDVRKVALAVLETHSSATVCDLAMELAAIPRLETIFSVEDVRDDLLRACQQVKLPLVLPEDNDEKRRRSYVRLVRYLEKRIVDGFGPDTGAFIHFPLDVPLGFGEEFQKTGGKAHHEHVVPRLLLASKCTEMLRSGIPPEQVARWVEPYVVMVKITPAEASILDHDLPLKTSMPEGWEFGKGCIFQRLHDAEIAFTQPLRTACCLGAPGHGAA